MGGASLKRGGLREQIRMMDPAGTEASEAPGYPDGPERGSKAAAGERGTLRGPGAPRDVGGDTCDDPSPIEVRDAESRVLAGRGIVEEVAVDGQASPASDCVQCDHTCIPESCRRGREHSALEN